MLNIVIIKKNLNYIAKFRLSIYNTKYTDFCFNFNNIFIDNFKIVLDIEFNQ